MKMAALASAVTASAVLSAGPAQPIQPPQTQTVSIRGRDQALHLYGTRGGRPVIVSSGDGGWIHLAPHVAHVLSENGFFVVGFDAKAYLESFTSGTRHAGSER